MRHQGAGGQWWSFDDTWSIGQRAAYIKSKGSLGGMIWEMSGDTPGGALLGALHSGLHSHRQHRRPKSVEAGPSADGPASPGGRYWVRTSDLFGVNEALSH